VRLIGEMLVRFRNTLFCDTSCQANQLAACTSSEAIISIVETREVMQERALKSWQRSSSRPCRGKLFSRLVPGAREKKIFLGLCTPKLSEYLGGPIAYFSVYFGRGFGLALDKY
jgi:hypothetical protein